MRERHQIILYRIIKKLEFRDVFAVFTRVYIYMEGQLCIPSRSGKMDDSFTLRTKKYIRIYSAHKVAEKKYTHKQKISEISTVSHIQKFSQDSSKLTFKSVSGPALQQTAQTLSYDIQKALSDKLELIRDLSTYDHEFTTNCNVFLTLHKIHNLAGPLPDTVQDIEKARENEQKCFENVNFGISKVALMKPGRNMDLQVETEKFAMKKRNLTQLLCPVFEGFTVISGVRCMVLLKSDKWLENLNFQVETLDGSSYMLSRTQNMSNSYYTPKEIFRVIQDKVLPFLTFRIEKQKVQLKFDPLQGLQHYTILSHIKGIGLCNLQVRVRSENSLTIEIPSLEQSLNVSTPQDAFELFENKISLTRVIKKNLIYSKPLKTLFWENFLEVFNRKDKISKLFDEDYLKSVMDMGHFYQVYSIKIEKIGVRVDCFAYKEQIILRATCDKETMEIDAMSKNYAFLQDFQCFSILKCPETLRRSLELEMLLFKMFPHSFKGK